MKFRVHVKYIHLSFMARLALTSININLLLTLVHVFDVILNNHFITIAISIVI